MEIYDRNLRIIIKVKEDIEEQHSVTMATAPGQNDASNFKTSNDSVGTCDLQTISIDNWEMTYVDAFGMVLQNSAGYLTATVRQSTCKLVFSCVEERPITVDTLRWVSKKVRYPKSGDKMIIISYLNAKTGSIDYLFFIADLPPLEKFYANLEAIVMQKFGLQGTGPTDPVVATVKSQPIFMKRMKVSIQSISEKSSTDDSYSDYMIILDLECLSLFSQSCQQPLHQLVFWVTPSPNTVEQVKLLPAKCIIVYTQTTAFKFQGNNAFIMKLKKSRPKQKHLFTDVKAMMDEFGDKTALTGPTKSVRRGFPPPPFRHKGKASEKSSHRTKENENQGTSQPGYSYNSDNAALTKLISELDAALITFLDVEDIQNIWISVEYHIKDTIEEGLIPLTDHSSGGLNPDSVDHLERTLEDIQDQFRENNVPVAISRLRACRELFKASNIQGIAALFLRDDLTLLKALYMKSLQS